MDENEYHREIGKRIKFYRRTYRYSQEALARGIGVSRNSVAGWEKGAPIMLVNLVRVSEFLGVDFLCFMPAGTLGVKSYSLVESADVSV